MPHNHFILFDNQDITRIGIRNIVKSVSPDPIITEVSNQDQLIGALSSKTVSIVIIDIYGLSDFDTESMLKVSERFLDTQWIIFSQDIAKATAQRLSTHSSFSLLLKSCKEDEIRTALRLSMVSERSICHQITNMLLAPNKEEESLISGLTSTEVEVLRLTALGKTVKEIAEERYSSIHTITAHKRSIFRKLEINTSYEATKIAIKAGLIDLIEYYI